jgi:hypothetical protein
MSLWYYEQLMPTGAWSPRTSPTRPSEVTPSGAKIKIRSVNDVPEEYVGCPIEFLRDYFSDVERLLDSAEPPPPPQEVATEIESDVRVYPVTQLSQPMPVGPQLIDHFAMAALPLAREHILSQRGFPSAEAIAEVAYDIASAMSRERQKRIR